jgi:hypothetical protein
MSDSEKGLAPVLRSRARAAVAPAAPIADDARLDLELRKAHAIARAGDAIPRGYRGNDGAVLLALEWAQHHGLTLLQVMQSVSFVQGRPVVDATAQRALAERAGYTVIPTEILPDRCTVTVSRGGQEIGRASYSLQDAKRANLLGKDNWRTDPEAMLVARATGRAIRRYAPTVLFGMASPDEIDDAPLESIPPRPEPLEAELVPTELDLPEQIDPTEIDGQLDGQLSIDDALEPEIIDVPLPEPEPVREPIKTTTRGALQVALERVDADGSRAELEAQVSDYGIDPKSLTARRFKELTEPMAQLVIELATELAPPESEPT